MMKTSRKEKQSILTKLKDNVKLLQRNNKSGITLIALVVTIIILLILAAIVINLTIGNNGLFSRAQNATAKYEEARVNEQSEMNAVIEEFDKVASGNNTGETTGEGSGESTGENEEGSGGNTGEPAEETETYVGYYADMNNDGEVDGLIYADLAQSKSGTWNSNSYSTYAYEAKTGLKNYYIREETETDDFGEKQVISPVSETIGEDRFYVMALDDFTQDSYSKFYWYYNGCGILDEANNVATDYNDFGKGKANTIKVMNYWNESKYGDQTTASSGRTYIDLWGAIQDGQYEIVTDEGDSGKWFIPSKAEWSAFGDTMYTKYNVTTSNYGNYGLSGCYFSSSQRNYARIYCAFFNAGYIDSYDPNNGGYVRLTATF